MTFRALFSPHEPGARWRRLWTGLFFGGLLLLGLLLVRDYGVSVDERPDRGIGLITVKYVGEKFFPRFVQAHADVRKQPALAEFPDRDYGTAFEAPVAWLEQWLGPPGTRDALWLRHAATFGICWLGIWGVYQLGRRRFADWRLGLLTALLLVLSPRLFAESFYNDKDAVFMALFALATNAAVAFVARPGWGRALLAALLAALTLDVRIMGVLVPLATLTLLALQLGHRAYAPRPAAQVLGLAGLYGLLLLGLAVAGWPYLWEHPWQHFTFAFQNMSRFRWVGTVLYRGALIDARKLPWHYSLVWIGITTPVLYLAGFLSGAFVIGRQLLRRGWRLYATEGEWQDLLFLGFTVAPIAAVVGLHSVLYDGWRQLYFIYPSLLLVAMRGLLALWRWRPAGAAWWQPLGLGVLALSLLLTAGQLMALHPLQNVYFNLLPGRHLEERYELDYWMLSYRQGLAWIAAHDNRLHIRVSGGMEDNLEDNRQLLPDFDRDRLEVVYDTRQADYFLTNYRWHPQPYDGFSEEAWSLRVGGHRVLSVFRTRWPTSGQ